VASAAWVCLTSSCAGRLTITTTEGAKTEGRWHVVADCTACGHVHLVTKHGIWLMSTCPGSLST
jgi:tRNA(Phe) wybutosine-synthesizing methylase Tyw3